MCDCRKKCRGHTALQAGLVAALACLAFALRGRSPIPGTPEDTVSAFFDAASRGDDRAYLALVGGEVRRSLAATRAEAGREAFRANLRRTASGIKGLAISRAGPPTDDQIALDVEIVLADRNERQRVTVSKRAAGWIITALGRAETARPAVPYGTPVFGPTAPDEAP